MKILIPLTGQLSGAGLNPEKITSDADGILLTETRRMLYDGGHVTNSLYFIMNYFGAFCGNKIVMEDCRYLQVIEDCRLKIEYLRFASGGSIIKNHQRTHSGKSRGII
jgi:hypothetical protein